MSRQKRSYIWKVSYKELKNIYDKAECLGDILKDLGFQNKGGNAKTLKSRLNEEGLDYSVLVENGKKKNLSGLFRDKKPYDEIMVNNSTFSRGTLKKRLLKDGILKNACSICGQKEIHNEKPLIMVLDHVNGINNDHRLENLRMICPNCNSQTKTFAGRKGKKEYFCKCGNCKTKNSHCCKKCKAENSRLIERPTKDQLKKMIEEISWCAIGRKYGVSDNAIRKWARAYKLI